MEFHPSAIKICQILNYYEHQAFIVGGCVRDILLGQFPKDFDIATDASPNKIIEIFPDNIPTGIKHGTISVKMDGEYFEVTTFRIEGSYLDGRHPEEVFFVMNLEQDLSRRDLTINAMAYDPINDEIIDPFNGREDLQNRLIKAVGDPNIRFCEDGLRIMRVARFATRFGYFVEDQTFQAMIDNLETLKKVSKERIKDELSKILMSEHAFYGLQLLKQSGALSIICPNIQEIHACKGQLETRLALLYHQNSTHIVNQELINLKFSNKEIKKVIFLLQLLERFYIFKNKDSVLTYKSFMAVVKNHAIMDWQETLEQFIIMGEALKLGVEKLFNKYQDEIVLSYKEMQINGDNLIDIGILPGPQIKQILDNCYLHILKYPEHNNLADLLKIVQKL